MKKRVAILQVLILSASFGSPETVALLLDCRPQSLVVFVYRLCAKKSVIPLRVGRLIVREEVDVVRPKQLPKESADAFNLLSLSLSA